MLPSIIPGYSATTLNNSSGCSVSSTEVLRQSVPSLVYNASSSSCFGLSSGVNIYIYIYIYKYIFYLFP